MILDRLEASQEARKKNTAPFPVLSLAVPTALVVLAAGLWFVSIPTNMNKRLAALETSAMGVKGAAKAGGDLKAFPPGTVCSDGNVEDLKSKLSGTLSTAGLQMTGLDVNDIGPAGAGGLEAYRVSFKGTGDYAAAVTVLGALGRQQPKLFIDSLALRNQVSAVELEVAGRLFCR